MKQSIVWQLLNAGLANFCNDELPRLLDNLGFTHSAAGLLLACAVRDMRLWTRYGYALER